MRVLQIVNVGVEAGGAEKSVRIIAEGLRARGHEVSVLATDHMFEEGRPRIADRFVPAVRGGAAGRLAGYFWNRHAYRETRRLVREFRPDCVHLHTIGEFSPAVLAATRSLPRVATVHGPEDWTLELLRWNLASAARGGALSPPDRLRYLYLRFLQRPAYLLWLRRIDRILAPSEYFAAAVRRDAGTVPVQVLANGIEPAAPAEAGPVDLHQVLYAGRLTRVKGVHVLVDAVRRLHGRGVKVRLSVVGDGDERAGLEAAAADLVQRGAVEFLGWRDQAHVTRLMSRAAVVVIPSLWPENFPTVALEALQAGRPLIASRVGGLPELVGADNGALVPAGDAEALADALERVLGDETLQATLGAGSLARAAAHEVEPFLDRIVECYREISRLTTREAVPRTVALVTPYYPPKIGGVERYVAELARGLAADGVFRPVVITTSPSGRRTTRTVEDGVTVIRLGVWLRISNTPLSPLWPVQVRRWLRRTGADLVNAHAPVPGLGDVAVLCAGKRPVVFTYHAGTMHKGAAGSGLADRIIAGYERWILPRVFARCDVPVPVGPSSLAARQEGAELIPPGVDLLRFTPGQDAARGRELIYVGRMDRTSAWKGVDVLIRAFAELAEQVPGLRLRLVGEGDALADHLELAERLGVRDRVEATGALAGEELVHAVQRAAALVLPSTTDAECAGTVLMEAMACATPVVASDVGSLAYVVGAEEAGLIVEPGRPEALAAAGLRILTEDGLAGKLGAAGRERAELNFSFPLLVARYSALFRRLADR